MAPQAARTVTSQPDHISTARHGDLGTVQIEGLCCLGLGAGVVADAPRRRQAPGRPSTLHLLADDSWSPTLGRNRACA